VDFIGEDFALTKFQYLMNELRDRDGFGIDQMAMYNDIISEFQQDGYEVLHRFNWNRLSNEKLEFYDPEYPWFNLTVDDFIYCFIGYSVRIDKPESGINAINYYYTRYIAWDDTDDTGIKKNFKYISDCTNFYEIEHIDSSLT
jgi:hypothetical protein